MDKFPAVAYHENGTHVVVANEAEAKKLGSGYSDTPNDKHIDAIRKASGSIGEVILPVTRTRQESI